MCKIMVAVGIKNPENAWKLAKEISPKLSIGNDDGLGYAAITSKGKIFAERWLKNKNAFKEYGLSSGDIELLKIMGPEMFKEQISDEYHSFGKKDENNVVCLTLHARAATGNTVAIQNTHPFVTEGTSLIHNGVIRNHEELTKKMSQCDSEVILHEYLDYAVSNDPEQIHGVIESIKGYYACAVLTNDKDGPILDLFKSPGATLYATLVKEVGGVVFCTSKTDLESALKSLNWELNKILEFDNDQFIRFNAISGEKLAAFKISSTEHYVRNYVPLYDKYKNKKVEKLNEIDEIIERNKSKVDYVRLLEEDEMTRVTVNSLS